MSDVCFEVRAKGGGGEFLVITAVSGFRRNQKFPNWIPCHRHKFFLTLIWFCTYLLGRPIMSISIEVQHRLMVNYLFAS